MLAASPSVISGSEMFVVNFVLPVRVGLGAFRNALLMPGLSHNRPPGVQPLPQDRVTYRARVVRLSTRGAATGAERSASSSPAFAGLWGGFGWNMTRRNPLRLLGLPQEKLTNSRRRGESTPSLIRPIFQILGLRKTTAYDGRCRNSAPWGNGGKVPRWLGTAWVRDPRLSVRPASSPTDHLLPGGLDGV
jgi:hypothetical protein